VDTGSLWSCRWDLNPWSPHYQCGALPLSYGSPVRDGVPDAAGGASSGEQSAPRTGHTSFKATPATPGSPTQDDRAAIGPGLSGRSSRTATRGKSATRLTVGLNSKGRRSSNSARPPPADVSPFSSLVVRPLIVTETLTFAIHHAKGDFCDRSFDRRHCRIAFRVHTALSTG
jgi:hypothetical protein